MRFMILVKSCDAFEAETGPTSDDQELMAEMVRYHEELARAGVLLDGSGLQPSRKGWRVHYAADGSKRIVDGPFAEAKEFISYALYQVRSQAEAVEWSTRFMQLHADRWPGWSGQADAVKVMGPEDFGPPA
mgnify:CR=1 FL=1